MSWGVFLDLVGHSFFHRWFFKWGVTLLLYLGGLLLPCDVHDMKLMIIVASLGATSISVDNAKSFG
jgi:hypothetical protein